MKKNLRAVILMLMICMMSSFIFSGCGIVQQDNQETSSRQDRDDKKNKVSDDTNSDEDNNDATEDVLNGDHGPELISDENIYTGYVEEYDEDGHYVSLELLDDNNCEFQERYIDEYENYRLFFYNATYKEEGDAFLVTFVVPAYDGEEDIEQIVKITTDGHDIVAAEYIYEDETVYNSIVGTYKCKLESGETAVLEVNGYDDYLLSIDGVDYETYLYNDSEYGWVLTAYDDSDYMFARWIVYFSGNRFTYDEYNFIQYQDIVGTYIIDGQLGMLDMDIDEYGMASIILKIDKKDYLFTGEIFETEGTITSAYLSSYVDDNTEYKLSLEFVPSSDESGNDYWYEGELQYIETTVLNAG